MLWEKTTKNGAALGSSENYFRVQALIADVSPKTAFEVMSLADKRQKWDPRMQEVKQIAEEANELTQYYLVKSPMFFITTRDVVVRQQRMIDYPSSGEYMYAFSSCEHSECPVNQNYIRSQNHLTGYKFVPAPEVNGVRMEWV